MTCREGGEGEPLLAEKLGFLYFALFHAAPFISGLASKNLTQNGLLTHIKLFAVKPQLDLNTHKMSREPPT
jgi:hypothetical protein